MNSNKKRPIGFAPGLALSLIVLVGLGATNSPANCQENGSKSGDKAKEPEAKQANPDYEPYLKDINRRVKRAWFPPKDHENDRLKVTFKIAKDGTMTDLRVLVTSGDALSDAAAKKAIENASPFAPLPMGASNPLPIEFTFDYSTFNGCGKAVVRVF